MHASMIVKIINVMLVKNCDTVYTRHYKKKFFLDKWESSSKYFMKKFQKMNVDELF